MDAISFLCSLLLSWLLVFAPGSGFAAEGKAVAKAKVKPGAKISMVATPEFLPLEKISQLNYWQRVRYLTEWRDTLAAVEIYSNNSSSSECTMAYHKSTKANGVCENPAPCDGPATGAGVSCNAMVVGANFCVPKSEMKTAAIWCNSEADRVSTKEKADIEKALNSILESHTKSASAQKILNEHAATLKKYSYSPMIQAFALRLAFQTNEKTGKWPQGFESLQAWNSYSEAAKANIHALTNECDSKNKKQKSSLDGKTCRSFMEKIAEARDSFSAISATLPDPKRDDSVAFLDKEMKSENSRMPASEKGDPALIPIGPIVRPLDGGAGSGGTQARGTGTEGGSGGSGTGGVLSIDSDGTARDAGASAAGGGVSQANGTGGAAGAAAAAGAPTPTPPPPPAAAPAADGAPKYETLSFGCDYPQMGRRSENEAGKPDIRVPFAGDAINCAVCPVVSAIRASKEISWNRKQNDLACDPNVKGVRCSGLGISPRWLALLNIAARTCQGISGNAPVDYETLMQYVQTFGACAENTAPFKDVHFESTAEEASYRKDTDKSWFSYEDVPMKKYELDNIDLNMEDLKALQTEGAVVVDRDSRNYKAKRKEFRLKAVYGMSPENLKKYFCPEKTLRYYSENSRRQPEFLKEMAKKRSQNVDSWTADADIKACAKEAFADPGSVARKVFSSSSKMCLASAPINSAERMPALSDAAKKGLGYTFQQQGPNPIPAVVTYDKDSSYQGCSTTAEMRIYGDGKSRNLIFDEPSRRSTSIEINGSRASFVAMEPPGVLGNKIGRKVNAIHTLSSSICPDATDTPKGSTGTTTSGTITDTSGRPITGGPPPAAR